MLAVTPVGEHLPSETDADQAFNRMRMETEDRSTGLMGYFNALRILPQSEVRAAMREA